MRNIWNKYDDDHSGKMDLKEFIEFVREIRLVVDNKINAEDLFKKVDSDNSGKIDYQEFERYFEELTSAKEFETDFLKYSGKKEYLDVSDLIKFMKEVQKENYDVSDAIYVILKYNNEIDDILLKQLSSKVDRYLNL